MEEINEYKKRFFSLLETKMGDVKPLITEADLATVEVVASHTMSDWYIRPDGSFVLKGKVPAGDKCFAVPASEIFYLEDKDKEHPMKYWTDLETSLKGQFSGMGGQNYQTLMNKFKTMGCPTTIRKTPKTEQDLQKPGFYLMKGDKGPLVTKLQKLLANKAEGYAHQLIQSGMGKPNFNPFDGIFGKITDDVVKTFQKENNLTPDGKVGKKTWDIIKDVPITYDWDIASQKFIPVNNNQTS